jgi:SAM-dependent methyltransferase
VRRSDDRPAYHRRQEALYRLAAPLYDRLIYPLLREAYAVGRGLLGPTAGLALLDVGTGTGNLALELATDGGRVVGVDLSPSLLAVAKRKAARGDGAPAITLARMDATELGYGDLSFDWVTAAMLMHEMPSPVRDRAVAEMARVARRGVLIIDYVRQGRPVHWGTAVVERLEGSAYLSYLTYPLEERLADCGLASQMRRQSGQFEALLARRR